MGAIEALMEAREKAAGGAFEDLFEMARDLDLRTVGKKTIEALACAGALDQMEGHRAQLAAGVDLAWQYAQKHQADKLAGQNSLFGGASGGMSTFVPALPHVEPWGKGEALRHERDLMGFYVSGHPLDDYAAEAKAFASVSLGDTEGVPHESDQTICGILTAMERKTTKSGRPIAFLTVEDTAGACEVVCFAQTLERFGHLLEVDQPMLVRGKAETSRGDLKLIAKEVLPMWRVREQLVQAITLKIDASGVAPEAIDELAALCAAHKGTKKLYIELSHDALPRPVRLHARTAVVDLDAGLDEGASR